jgi:hypothetical protein
MAGPGPENPGGLTEHPFVVLLKQTAALSRTLPDARSMSPKEVIYHTMLLRDEERREVVRGASAASVPYLDKKEGKKWWRGPPWR